MTQIASAIHSDHQRGTDAASGATTIDSCQRLSSAVTSNERTRQLLTSGVVAGALFIGVTTIQILTRPGFDLRRLAISVLALGDFGWVQTSNFILSGLLTIAFAVGVRQTLRGGRAGTFGPILIAANGLALLLAGMFTTDAGLGFPPGAPDTIPDPLSWHAQIHSLAFFLAVISIVLASMVLARRFARLHQWRWVACCAITAVAMPALVAYGMTNLSIVGVAFFAMAIVMSGWNAAIALHLRSNSRYPVNSLRSRPAVRNLN